MTIPQHRFPTPASISRFCVRVRHPRWLQSMHANPCTASAGRKPARQPRFLWPLAGPISLPWRTGAGDPSTPWHLPAQRPPSCPCHGASPSWPLTAWRRKESLEGALPGEVSLMEVAAVCMSSCQGPITFKGRRPYKAWNRRGRTRGDHQAPGQKFSWGTPG